MRLLQAGFTKRDDGTEVAVAGPSFHNTDHQADATSTELQYLHPPAVAHIPLGMSPFSHILYFRATHSFYAKVLRCSFTPLAREQHEHYRGKD